jgi:DtxR family Mn-dependent transcriptional regulator
LARILVVGPRAVDRYLEAIYRLSSGGEGRVRPARVAEALAVSRASAGEALERLARAGLVARGSARDVALTAAGLEIAERAAWRRRVAEGFLTEVLGYSPEEARSRAGSMASALPDEMVDRIARRLGAAYEPVEVRGSDQRRKEVRA